MRDSTAGNRDACNRCGVRHGGNNHSCPVHGTVSRGCCEPACNPAEWEGYSMETGWVSGQAPRRKADAPQIVAQ